MPKVDKLDNLQDDYTVRKFGEPFKEGPFIDQLEALKVTIHAAPSPEEFRNMVSVFLANTWQDNMLHAKDISEEEKDRIIDEVFRGELLPTAMEVPNIMFSIEGLDNIEVLHLIRHRVLSFSAQVAGDRSIEQDPILVKPGIMNHPEFFERYKDICNDARRLYHDMLNSGEIHGLDARSIMPRSTSLFYFVRGTIKDLIGYVRMRYDEQIQSESDCIIALQLWLEILKLYPWLKPCIDLDAPDAFYVKQSKAGKRNIFAPNEKNDVFDWETEQFYHGDKTREDFLGGTTYLRLRDELLAQIEAIEPNHWRPASE